MRRENIIAMLPKEGAAVKELLVNLALNIYQISTALKLTWILFYLAYSGIKMGFYKNIDHARKNALTRRIKQIRRSKWQI